jgi:hypothetical protein
VSSRYQGRRRRGSKWRSSRVRACGARSSQSGRNIHGGNKSNWKLWIKIGDFLVLDEVNARDLLYHHHNLWGTTTAAKSVPGDAENLLQDKVKDGEMLLFHIELD